MVLAKLMIFLPLIATWMALAAPLSGDMSTELLQRKMRFLSADPAFSNLSKAGARIAEIADYEGGLYFRYWLNGNECVGQWMLNPGTGLGELKLDLKCSQAMAISRNPLDGVARPDLARIPEVPGMLSAIRFLTVYAMLKPPVARVLRLSVENDRLTVVYLTNSAVQCAVALVPLAPMRRDSPTWFAHEPACDAR